MERFEAVKELIKSRLTDAHVEITDLTGTQDHLGILVVSDEFKGRPLLEQHQMVMNILGDKLKSEIHAVQIKTLTKERHQKLK